jgi:hypothetical protein
MDPHMDSCSSYNPETLLRTRGPAQTLPLGASQNPAENLLATATKPRRAHHVTTLIWDGQTALLRCHAMEAHAKGMTLLVVRDGKSGHARCVDPR